MSFFFFFNHPTYLPYPMSSIDYSFTHESSSSVDSVWKTGSISNFSSLKLQVSNHWASLSLVSSACLLILLSLNLSSTLGSPCNTFFTRKSKPPQFSKKECFNNVSAEGLFDGSSLMETRSHHVFENLGEILVLWRREVIMRQRRASVGQFWCNDSKGPYINL